MYHFLTSLALYQSRVPLDDISLCISVCIPTVVEGGGRGRGGMGSGGGSSKEGGEDLMSRHRPT